MRKQVYTLCLLVQLVLPVSAMYICFMLKTVFSNITYIRKLLTSVLICSGDVYVHVYFCNSFFQ